MENAGRAQAVVLDFGGQYGHLIARRLRELGIFVYHVPVEALGEDELEGILSSVRAVVLSGGPASVWEKRHDRIVEKVLEAGLPVLGICYGHQLLAHVLGGVVGRSPKPEFGPTYVEIVRDDPIFRGFPRRLRVWMSHNDAVLKPPEDAKVLAVSPGSPVAAFRYKDRITYGVQWHPEVVHSERGKDLLSNWVDLVGLERSWNIASIVSLVKEDLERQLANVRGRLLAAVSGGVDSTVAAVVVRKFSNREVEYVIIDHGLHHEEWIESSVEALSKLDIKVEVIDESDLFLDSLRGVEDPEEKRRIISRLYFEVLKREIQRRGASGLVQGTIYPDIVESGAIPGSDKIKTHHNIGLRSVLKEVAIIEPLRWIYKDEVRKLGRHLGVPEHILKRQPIPGPGLATRIEGEVTREKLKIVRAADRIVREVLESRGLHEGLWQYFAVLTRSRATGVKGDRRAYGSVVALRAVVSTDAMTASAAHLPWDVLEEIMARITSEVPGVTRVVYDITSKPPGTIEWE